MNLRKTKSGAWRELDMRPDELARLKDHLNNGFAEIFSEAKNAAQSGIDYIADAAKQADGEAEAEAFRALASEEARQVKKYVDKHFGGRSLGVVYEDE